MSLTITQSSDPLTLTLTGRLDTHTAPELDRVLDGVLQRRDVRQLIFDLANLEYMSSAGIRCLLRARKSVEPKSGSVSVVNPQPSVRKVLDIVKALPRENIFSSDKELDAYLDAMQRQVREKDKD